MIWVPRDADGMEIDPIETMGGRETNHLYLTDCAAPAERRARRGRPGLDAADGRASTSSA